MLRKLKRLSALALCLTLLLGLLAVPASANYDIYVNAKDGLGLNLRTGPGTEYSKVRPNPIPMYTKLNISQTQDSASGLPWGYTSYQGDSGWVCLVETTTYDPTPKASATVNSADPLASIAYIGDPARCRMDAAMTNAYLSALANLPTTGTGYWGGTLHAALVDVGGDGLPLLFTVYLYEDAPNIPNECSDPVIWEYRNGRAVAHDFSQDYNGYSSDPTQFSIDSLQYEPVFRADANGGGAVDPVQGSLFYTVADGQMTLCHTYVHYTMENRFQLDGSPCGDYDTVMAQLGQTDSSANQDLTMNGSTLFLECETSRYDVMCSALNAHYQNLSSQSADTPEEPEASSPEEGADTPEEAPPPPSAESAGSTGAVIALGIIIFLLLVVVILFVVMLTKLKKKH